MAITAISLDNASIAELDQAIREKLQTQGYVGPDVYEGTTLVGVRDTREAGKKRAASYNVDDIIRWTRSSTLGGRARVSSSTHAPLMESCMKPERRNLRWGIASS